MIRRLGLRAAMAAAAAGSLAAIVTATAAAADLAPTDDIRDIRGPKGMLPAWLIPAVIAAAVLLALGGYALWRWKRRQRPSRILEPFEIALQRLEDIRRLLAPAHVREFSIAITDIVRQYIEASFHITATHRTTEEFLHDLLDTSNKSLAAHRALLAEFLSRCDMAKYAGMSLSRQIMESLHQSARSFVTETSKPVPTDDATEATTRAALASSANAQTGGP